MERLIDTAAHEMGIDRGEIRRKNFIQPDQMPFDTHTGWTYDTGDYAAALDKCLSQSDWDGYESRQAASAAAGKQRGRSVVYYVDNTGIFNARMEIRFGPAVDVIWLGPCVFSRCCQRIIYRDHLSKSKMTRRRESNMQICI